jgi:dolichyl-phosphate-mannose-protein mannosyltransferase
LDHLFFGNPRDNRPQSRRLAWFVVWTLAVVVNFWWFKDLALGVHGNINDHKGWKWRSSWNVSNASMFGD